MMAPMSKQVKSDVESFARIRVVGVGGSGGNAVNHMVASGVEGVDFIAINTDAQDLHKSKSKKKIHIGKTLTMRLAEQGLSELRKAVDALIIIPNDKLLAIVSRETGIKNAFAMCDDILKQAVEGISDLITTTGIINVDFADVRAIMHNAGSALMGIGTAIGEHRAEMAARAAINSPLLEVSIHGAKGVLFSVAGGEDLGMLEVQDAANVITEAIDPEAKVIFGAVTDGSLKKGAVRVTVIATGFPDGAARTSLFAASLLMIAKKDQDS